MDKKFQRRIENFTCGHCGAHVTGNGYTNHCPACLYSCHVDINPGDRANMCGGLMEPTGLEQKDGGWVIRHVCVTCGGIMRCKAAPDDAILDLAAKIAQQKSRG